MLKSIIGKHLSIIGRGLKYQNKKVCHQQNLGGNCFSADNRGAKYVLFSFYLKDTLKESLEQNVSTNIVAINRERALAA